MVRIRELKVFRPTFIMLQLLLALVVIVGFASAQDVSHQDQAEQDGLENADTEIAMPNQFGQNNVTEEEGKNATAVAEDTQAMIAIGAALAIGIAGIGSATGIGIAGAAGIGATAEKPERFGKSLVLQAMPMTQGIYGLLIAILLLMFGGLLGGGGGDVEFLSRPYIGLTAIAIGLAVGLTGISAIGQGITASASIGGAARNPEVFSKGMIFTVMSETLAIFGLLTGILIMVGVGFLG
jgi:V/A-type H+-transporting ATPase subunit K